MKFLADENVAASVVLALRNAGYKVVDVKDSHLRGKSDKAIISYAAKNNCVVFTHDKDFLYQTRIPVLLLRFSNQKPKMVAKRLLAFLESQLYGKLKKPLTVVLSEHTAEFHHT